MLSVGGIETGILILASIISLLVGLSVYIKNPKSVTHILFGLLSLSLVFWSVSNYFSLRVESDQASFTVLKLIFSGVVIQNTLFLLFSSVFPSIRRTKFSFAKTLFVLFTFFLLLLVSLDFVVSGFRDGNLKPGPGMLIFALHAAISVLWGFRYLMKHEASTTFQKKYLVYGSVILWVVVPVTNFVLPSFLNVTIFIRFSSLYVLLFNVIISYAILKHRLFDLRAVVARASAYVLTVSIFLTGYLFAINSLNSTLNRGSSISVREQALYAAIAVLSAPLLLLMKRFFDKITNSLFYRDRYDTQHFIDKLNQALVNNVELESLLTKCALVIQENLKTSFCTFYIRETSYFSGRIIGAHRKQPEVDEFDTIQELAPKMHKKIITSEDDSENQDHKKLVSALKKNDIEVMARMVNTLDFEVKGIGYIFLGAKRSGSSYSSQDLKIIEIIANELVIAIENVLRFEEIEQFNVTLQKKIDDATKELKTTNEKLRALDEAKDEFVSMASHQLRTPLTSIKGYISMVMEGDAGKITPTQKDMLGQAFFSSQRMVYLISDLLNVSRLKTGKFLIESKPVYLPNLVEDEMAQLQEGAKAKNITLSYTKPKSFPTLNLDDMKIRQVVMNFTDNAIYYTPAGGKITLQLKETPKTVEFTVTDTGIGVPKEQQPKMFTKFYRADNARKARPDGTGLGLFMAKKVVIAQGGSIIFASKEGKGSTFGFSFPKDKVAIEKVADTQEEPK